MTHTWLKQHTVPAGVEVGALVRYRDEENAKLLTENLGKVLEVETVAERIRIGFPNVFGTLSTTSVWYEQFDRYFEIAS